MFQVSKKGGFELCKLPIQGEHFVQAKAPKRMLGKIPGNSTITIIHNRAATRGEVSQENCHPFMHPANPKNAEKAIVGVHNGTLHGNLKWEDKTFDVDSDWLMHEIYKKGGLEALKDVNGSFACVWYENDGNLKIATNHTRPLYWGYIKGKNAMLLASEHGMMYWLASRNDIELEKVVAPDKDKIYTFNMNGKVRDFQVEDIPPKVYGNYAPAVGGYGYGANNRGSAAATGNFPARGSGSTGDTKVKELKDFGLRIHDTIPFSPLGVVTESTRVVEGMVETFDHDVVDAFMPNVNPQIVRAMQGCTYVMCQVKTGRWNDIKERFEVVVGHPLSVVSTDERPKEEPKDAPLSTQQGEFSDLDDLDDHPALTKKTDFKTPSGMVRGPGGRLITEKTFHKLVENGCAMCGDQTMGVDEADAMEWTNHTNDPVCAACVEHNKTQTNNRKAAKAAEATA